MIWLGILILLVLGLIAYELVSIHTTLHTFTQGWKDIHAAELEKIDEGKLLRIKNELMGIGDR